MDLATRFQVMLERLKSDQIEKFLPFLQQAERDAQMRLLAFDVTEYDRILIGRLLDSIETDLRGIFGKYTTQLTGDLVDTAVYAAQVEQRNLAGLNLQNFEPAIPTPEQIRTAVLTAPLSVQGYNEGALLEAWLSKWTDAQIDLVSGTVRQGYYQGLTTSEVVRRLRGTAKQRYKDGTMAQIQRSDTILVRTAMQQAANTARDAVYQANTDVITGVRWVSTLDLRTTSQCRSLDGREFPLKEGPRPPLHPGCRSTTIPTLDSAFDVLDKGATRASKGDTGGKQVPANQTYYEWLKTQPAAFQDLAIGKERGLLLRNGGLSAERFAELQLGQNFQPLTLEDMRKLEPAAFERAGI